MKLPVNTINYELEKIKSQERIPGMSISLLIDRKVIWSKGFGYANLEKKTPATPRTIYAIGSITKLFTAIMLMQLRESKKLNLDDSVTKYLDDPQDKIFGPNPPTIGNLATHVAGLPMDGPREYWSTLKFPSKSELLNSLEEIEMAFPPMTKLKYSNLGYAILGHILEIVANRPFEAYIQDRILRPLNMKYSTFTLDKLDKRLRTQVATGYIINGDEVTFAPSVDLKAFSPAGQLFSTVDDISRIILMQFLNETHSQKRILSKTSLREMQLIHSIESDWSYGFGIGWMMEKFGNFTIWEHAGKLPGFTTVIAFIREKRLGVAFFANTSSIWPYDIVRKIFGIILPVLERIEDKRNILGSNLKYHAAMYSGKYFMNNFNEIEIKKVKNYLYLFEEFKKPSLLVPISKYKFRIQGGDRDGETAIFKIDLNNRVTLSTGGGTKFRKVIT
jgi:CubicO group peptidase (beta-lactamase class C family)